MTTFEHGILAWNFSTWLGSFIKEAFYELILLIANRLDTSDLSMKKFQLLANENDGSLAKIGVDYQFDLANFLDLGFFILFLNDGKASMISRFSPRPERFETV